MFALGLPGFCTFLYVVRVLQAMQRTRVAFWLYLVENVINIALALALVHPMGVRGLALALSVAYSVSAVAGIVVLRRWIGPLGSARTWAPLRLVCISTLAMGLVVLLVSNVSGSNSDAALALRVIGAAAGRRGGVCRDGDTPRAPGRQGAPRPRLGGGNDRTNHAKRAPSRRR